MAQIKPQADVTFERVSLRVPGDVWSDVCQYAKLLGAATTPHYVCVEAIKAAVRSRDYRELVEKRTGEQAPSTHAAPATDPTAPGPRPIRRSGSTPAAEAVA